MVLGKGYSHDVFSADYERLDAFILFGLGKFNLWKPSNFPLSRKVVTCSGPRRLDSVLIPSRFQIRQDPYWIRSISGFPAYPLFTLRAKPGLTPKLKIRQVKQSQHGKLRHY